MIFLNNNKDQILKNLIDLDGIGETQVNSLNSFFSNDKNVVIVKKLIQELKIVNFKTVNTKGKFSDKTIMFTGGFEKMSRSEAKSLVENNGGKVLGTISKKLDMLVTGNSKPTQKKIEAAKKLNVKIKKKTDWYKF